MKNARSYRKSSVPENAKRVFEGLLFDVFQWEQKLYDGSADTFEKIARSDTAVIYPVLPDGNILLIKDSQPQRATVITAPAGRLEDGELPETCAARELLEETGYVPEKAELFYTFTPHEKIDWVVHVFIGTGCKRVAEPHLEAGEHIELYPVSFDEMIDLTIEGKLRQEGFDRYVMQVLKYPEKMEELKRRFLN